MYIKLKGELHSELTRFGCKPGDVIQATPDTVSKVGAMQFVLYHSGITQNCTVWPENYEIVSENEIAQKVLVAIESELQPIAPAESFEDFYQRVVIEKRHGQSPQNK